MVLCLNKVTFSFTETLKYLQMKWWQWLGLTQNLSGSWELWKTMLIRPGLNWSLSKLFYGYMEFLTLNFLLWYNFEVFHNKMFWNDMCAFRFSWNFPLSLLYLSWKWMQYQRYGSLSAPWGLKPWGWEWKIRKMVKSLGLWQHYWASDFLHKNKFVFLLTICLLLLKLSLTDTISMQ